LLKSEEEGTKSLRNVTNYLPVEMAQYPRRSESAPTPLWEPEISNYIGSLPAFETVAMRG